MESSQSSRLIEENFLCTLKNNNNNFDLLRNIADLSFDSKLVRLSNCIRKKLFEFPNHRRNGDSFCFGEETVHIFTHWSTRCKHPWERVSHGKLAYLNLHDQLIHLIEAVSGTTSSRIPNSKSVSGLAYLQTQPSGKHHESKLVDFKHFEQTESAGRKELRILATHLLHYNAIDD